MRRSKLMQRFYLRQRLVFIYRRNFGRQQFLLIVRVVLVTSYQLARAAAAGGKSRTSRSTASYKLPGSVSATSASIWSRVFSFCTNRPFASTWNFSPVFPTTIAVSASEVPLAATGATFRTGTVGDVDGVGVWRIAAGGVTVTPAVLDGARSSRTYNSAAIVNIATAAAAANGAIFRRGFSPELDKRRPSDAGVFFTVSALHVHVHRIAFDTRPTRRFRIRSSTEHKATAVTNVTAVDFNKLLRRFRRLLRNRQI